ncbi:MAG: FAD-linked oxidase C-terminal domain-containing protein [Candidatus Hermodarchaeota archaeon]
MKSEYNKISETMHQNFKRIVGKENYFSDFEIRWSYAFGGTAFNKEWIPDLILTPTTTEQIKKVLEIANKHDIPVIPRGSGTSLSAGTMSAYGGIILDLSGMNKIISIDIENNMVEVEPGVICDELNEILKVQKYFFPPDPASSSACTIGGMVATNAGGVQAFKYGVTKDYILYLEVVLADGNVIKLGSEVLKSVSSYNLKDLFVGSEGTLGIITKIGLRIIPLPRDRKLGLYMFDKIDKITKSVIELRKAGIVPNLIEFLDKLTTKAVFEYLGGEFLDYPEGYILLVELDGINEHEITENFRKMHEIMLSQEPLLLKIADNEIERDELIKARKNALPALARISPTCCLEDCTIQITNFSEVIQKIENIPQDLKLDNIKVATFGHMEGNLHPTFLFNENDDFSRREFEFALDFLYKKIIIPLGGTITGEHGIGKIKTPFLTLEHGLEILDIMHEIKKLFDPNMILNPGQGKGDKRPIKKLSSKRFLKNQEDKVLSLNCMRCGLCGVSCPSRIYYKVETYSPRGRLSILNGLVHGDLVLNDLINDILHSCTLCGLCLEKCPAGVKTYQIFEKAREIIHKS